MADTNADIMVRSSQARARIEARSVSADDAERVIELGSSLKHMREDRDAGRRSGSRELKSAFDDAVSYERIRHPAIREQALAVINTATKEFPNYANELKAHLPSVGSANPKDDPQSREPIAESRTVQMVREDLADLSSIQGKKDRQEALLIMATNVERSDAYIAALTKENREVAVEVNRTVVANNDRRAVDKIKKDVADGIGSLDSPHERAVRDSTLFEQIVDKKRREQARQAIAEGIDKEPNYATELRAVSPEVFSKVASPETRPAATKETADKQASHRGDDVQLIAGGSDNSIRQAVDVSPTIRYTVGRSGKPGQEFKDVEEAATRFVATPAAERPYVMREVIDSEGRASTAFVAGTQVRDREGARTPEKVIAPALDQELASAVRSRAGRGETPPRDVGTDRVNEVAAQAGSSTSKPAVEREEEEQRRALDSYFIKRGKEYRFNQNTEVVAFTESKMFERDALTTKHNDNELVIKAMLDRSEEKKWNAIEVAGTPEFKQQVWLEASTRGKVVYGYEPSKEDLGRLHNRLAHDEVQGQNTIAAAHTKENAPSISSETRSEQREGSPTFKGEVVDMGHAPYKHKNDEPDSYYITLRGVDGRDVTVWGKDLERAVAAADVRIGDRVADIRRTEKEAVTVTANVRDDKDVVVGHERKQTHLNRWEIQKEYRELSGVEQGLVRELERSAPEQMRDKVRTEAHRQLDDLGARGLQHRVELYDTRVTAQRTREPRIVETPNPEPTHSH